MRAVSNKLKLAQAMSLLTRVQLNSRRLSVKARDIQRQPTEAASNSEPAALSSKPARELLPEPQAPGPEDCCQVGMLDGPSHML